MTNLTSTVGRRSALAFVAAAAATFPVVSKAPEAAPVAPNGRDWKALHAELIAAHLARRVASDAHAALHEAILHKLPECVVTVPFINDLPTGWVWSREPAVLFRTPASVNENFDKLTRMARKYSPRWGWSDTELGEFLSEGEGYRRQALSELEQKDHEWTSIWEAEMSDADAAVEAAEEREDAIEDLVRALPANTLEAIHLKLILGRRYTDDFEFDKEILDGMLSDLGAVTGFRGNEIA